MSIVDFILDLLWGASEAYLGRKRRTKTAAQETSGSGAGSLAQKAEKGLKRAQSDRDEVSRIVGNKTV